MTKSLGPVSLLVGALLLSTTSLEAKEPATQSNFVSKAAPSGRDRTPHQPPGAVPTGDDDMPDRRDPGHQTLTPMSPPSVPMIAESQGSGWQRFVAGMRLRWMQFQRVLQ
jgi:hypothetical protein